MNIEWTTIWRAVWGSMSEDRADSIEEYLAEKLHGCTKSEIRNAVEKLANQPSESKMGNGAPSIRDLEWTIRSFRGAAKASNNEPLEVTRAKQAMLSTPKSKRWDLVCGLPDSLIHWCRHLEDYAIAHGGLIIPRFVWGNHNERAERA